MAHLEYISFRPHRSHIEDGGVIWRSDAHHDLNGLPSICWEDGEPWREANLWFRKDVHEFDIDTVRTRARAIYAYAKWLEQTNSKWWGFPIKEEDRCLVRYRGFLIKNRDAGRLAPSLATARMRVVVRFYRWLTSSMLLSPEWPMWRERIVGIRVEDKFGFQRTIDVQSTNLAIPNRGRPGARLEGGLTPVSDSARQQILVLANAECSQELALMLNLGFFTGLRLGAILDLKCRNLERAVPAYGNGSLALLAVGPNANPPVHTKFDVSGKVWIPRPLLEELLAYCSSPRRLLREAKANKANADLVFLTRYGDPYARSVDGSSSAINVEMCRLRKKAADTGLAHFKFHQTRATFGTAVAEIALATGNPNPVEVVRDALLHKDEATSLKYIKFVRDTRTKSALGDEFSRAFMGALADRSLAHA